MMNFEGYSRVEICGCNNRDVTPNGTDSSLITDYSTHIKITDRFNHEYDSGNHYTDELMNVNPKHLYKGQLLLILRSTQQPGTVTVKASSPALKAANYKFSSQ